MVALATTTLYLEALMPEGLEQQVVGQATTIVFLEVPIQGAREQVAVVPAITTLYLEALMREAQVRQVQQEVAQQRMRTGHRSWCCIT